MFNQPQQKLPGIAQVLMMEQLLDEQQAKDAQKGSQQDQIPFVQFLIKNNTVNAKKVAVAASKNFGVPLLDLHAFDRDMLPQEMIEEKFIRRYHSLPLYQRGDNLYIAVDDPSNSDTVNEIKFQTGKNVHVVVVEADKLDEIINDVLTAKESAALGDYLEDSDNFDLDISSGEDEIIEEDNPVGSDDAPVVRFINKILLDAINRGASDIHFEPYESRYRIRFRQDGLLYEVTSPPLNLSARIAARIKILSSLDISERRVPQDGRFKMRLSRKNSIDFRVSTCPTVNGEKIVMRILDPTAANLGVEALGFSEPQIKLFNKAIHEPQGMVLVTGPTGSGKTVTLYTALNMLNTVDRNISTAEDPVEIKVPGVNQVNINLKTGLTFPGALRSFLRQDPDVIMVGEMRDLETAEIGIKAAQTGHMVLSTLHTNSAPETLTRMANMGIPPFNIASSVSLIIAQRLARRLCTQCKKPTEIPYEVLRSNGYTDEDLDGIKIYGPEGCNYCANGYKGRVGLYEVMPITKTLSEIIMRGGNSLELEKQAIQEGMITIRKAGFEKVKEGITSIEEISRVTKD